MLQKLSLMSVACLPVEARSSAGGWGRRASTALLSNEPTHYQSDSSDYESASENETTQTTTTTTARFVRMTPKQLEAYQRDSARLKGVFTTPGIH